MAQATEIERALQEEVGKLFEQDRDGVSVKSVRARVEEQLSLESGFLKGDEWKARSKELITRAFDELEQKSDEKPASSAAVKRKSETSKSDPTKKPRTATEDENDAEMLRDSELSDVIDHEPKKPKKRSQAATSKVASAGARSKTKAKSAARPDATPQEAEIKTLQSQLAKCGIRRLWGKELKRFDSDKEKIALLKTMLRDVGMEGRFSEDKARRIKEEREFKADLDEIRQGNDKWGRSDGEETEQGAEGRPKRKLAKGLAELQVFEDDEESE